MRPFKINVDEKELSDFKKRLELDLERGVIPPLEDAGFTYGFNGDYLRQGSDSGSHILIHEQSI